MRIGLWIGGGLCVGAGIVTALGRFGEAAGFGLTQEQSECAPGERWCTSASQVYESVGYDAMADIQVFGSGWVAIFLALIGLVMMVTANATAYKETGGY